MCPITEPKKEITLPDILSKLFVEKYTWTSDDLLAFSMKILAVLFAATIILPLALLRIILAVIIFILFMLYIVVKDSRLVSEKTKTNLVSDKNILKKPINIEKFKLLKEKINKTKSKKIDHQKNIEEIKQSIIEEDRQFRKLK